ncbi:7-cyano-7-deazaguanine synthase [compost metagenome]
MKTKSLVLLSSGLDSTVNAFEASVRHDLVMALTFDYGQRAAESEVRAAKKISAHLGVKHKVLSLPWFKDFNRSSLLVADLEIPTGEQVQIDSHAKSEETAKSVWVPNRNGIFLNIAAAFAESLDAEIIIPGFNKEEAATFPDNSEEFLNKATASLWYSTSNHVKVECYTSSLVKSEIVARGEELKVPWELIWPCYFSGDQWCGQCESCLRSKRAFASAGVNVLHLYKG